MPLQQPVQLESAKSHQSWAKNVLGSTAVCNDGAFGFFTSAWHLRVCCLSSGVFLLFLQLEYAIGSALKCRVDFGGSRLSFCACRCYASPDSCGWKISLVFDLL